MISDFDLQTRSLQLWPEIKERLDAKESEIAALTKERDSLQKKVSCLLTCDADGLKSMQEEEAKSDKQKAIESAQAEVKAAQAKLDALA